MSETEGEGVNSEIALEAAIKNIRECMVRKSAFTQVSLDNFKKKEKESYDAIVKVLKTEVNDHTKWVDEILSLAGNSKSENVKKYLDEVNHRLKGLIFDPTITNNDDLDGSAQNSNKYPNTDGDPFDSFEKGYRPGSKSACRPLDRETTRKRERLSIEKLRCASQDVEMWFRRYELETREYHDGDKVFYLPLYLTDEAFDAYDRFPRKNCVSYEEMKDYIIKSWSRTNPRSKLGLNLITPGNDLMKTLSNSQTAFER